MPFRRVPERVGAFQKWASTEVKNSKLSDSATPHGKRGSGKSAIRRRRRRARKKKVQD